MRLWGLTKIIKRFWSFQRSSVFQYTVQDDLQNRFLDLGVLKAPLGPDDVLDVIVSIIPKKNCYLVCLKHHSVYVHIEQCLVSLTSCNTQKDCKPIQQRFKPYCFKALRLFIYLRTTYVSHGMEYLGRAGLKLKTPFKNLYTKDNFPDGISSQF